MPKWTALGDVADKSLADVDPDSVSNIYDEESLGVPKPGPYLAVVKRLQGTESKAGDPMLKMVVELAEPKGSKKARYNGYGIWNYIVSTKDTASRVNQFLHAILDGKPPAQRKKIIDQYWAGNVVLSDDDNKFITKIGTWMVPDSIQIGINTAKENSAEYGERLKIAFGGIMPASERPASKVADEDPDEAYAEDEDEADEVDEEVDEEFEAREEELNGLSLAELRALAKELGVTGKGKGGLVTAILGEEFAEEDEAEDDEEADEEEEAEEGDEYDEMDRAALRAAAKELGVRVLKSDSDDDLRGKLREAAEDNDEEDEEDEEDEPEPPVQKGRARATAAAPGRAAAKRRRGSSDDEPPF